MTEDLTSTLEVGDKSFDAIRSPIMTRSQVPGDLLFLKRILGVDVPHRLIPGELTKVRNVGGITDLSC